MKSYKLVTFAALLFCLVQAQAADAPRGAVETIVVHGKALEGNLDGDSPDRQVSVLLPPSYAKSRNKRYPVLYFLHGYTDSNERWFGAAKHFINLPDAVNNAWAAGASEMIVVMPNAYTRFQGSMYSRSVVVGDWETFIVRDLVNYIDKRYRTIANVNSRGLAGHSMGGYGAMRIGMKHPETFSALYALSPCCMEFAPGGNQPNDAGKAAEAIKTMEEFEKASFYIKAQFASAAAWAPNPKNPPFYIDLPTANGQTRPQVIAKFMANAPLAMIDQYMGNLKLMRGIAVDAGDMDNPIAGTVRTLHETLDANGVRNDFEIYSGDHVNRIAERVTSKVMPFFSANLVASRGDKSKSQSSGGATSQSPSK